MPAWRDAGPDGAHRRGARGAGAHQRAQPRDGAGGHAHVGPGLRDGLPGRRPARPGPGARGGRLRLRRDDPARRRVGLGEAAGQAPAAADGQALHRGPARGRPRHRLQHLPDLELLPRAVRQPGHRQRRRRQAAPARRPAARDHRRRRARGARRGGLLPRPRDARCRARRRGPGQDPGRTPRGPPHRLHRVDRLRHLAGAATRTRRWSSPRRPASTRSCSTRRTTTAGCSPTSRSRCRSTAVRCARRRRTCWCPATASPPTASPARSTQLGADLAAAVDGLLGDDARASALLGAVVNDGVRERLEQAPSFGDRGARVARGRQPGLPRRDGAHADGRAGRRGRPRDLPAGVLRAGVVPRHHRQHAGLAAHPARLGARARGHHGGRLLHRRQGARGGRAGSPGRRGRAARRTSPRRSTSTSRRRSATSTRPGPTRPRTPP